MNGLPHVLEKKWDLLSFKPGISPGGLNPAGEKEGPMGLSAFRLMMHHGIAHKRSLLFMVGM